MSTLTASLTTTTRSISASRRTSTPTTRGPAGLATLPTNSSQMNPTKTTPSASPKNQSPARSTNCAKATRIPSQRSHSLTLGHCAKSSNRIVRRSSSTLSDVCVQFRAQTTSRKIRGTILMKRCQHSWEICLQLSNSRLNSLKSSTVVWIQRRLEKWAPMRKRNRRSSKIRIRSQSLPILRRLKQRKLRYLTRKNATLFRRWTDSTSPLISRKTRLISLIT